MSSHVRLREWRKAAGLTQEAAAEAAEVSQSLISHIEQGGTASLPVLRKLLALYGVSAEQAGLLLVEPGTTVPSP